ncbi:hypothetical protein [Sphingomonas sp. 28-62-11]|uniref:hypothetical protein n=1 Tax=Sphingomonas sp. 28-62-11 TaxID=1970432 RepID=UPI000BC71565|nr:MAG: hypothetical protein B7Y49_13420 [Sphingomonas sp. 28-62-11]
MAAEDVALTSALDRLIAAANRQEIDSPAFATLRALYQQAAHRMAGPEHAEPQLIAAIHRASEAIEALDPLKIGRANTIIVAMRVMAGLRKTSLRMQRDVRKQPADRRAQDVAAADPEGLLPASIDLRTIIPDVASRAHIGPSTANSIAACIHDARRLAGHRAQFESSRVQIQYGEQIIESAAPMDGDFQVLNGIRIKPDDGCRPIAANLSRLKERLAEGLPFAFLFLNRGGADCQGEMLSDGTVRRSELTDFPKAQTATAVGYDDSQRAFIVLEYARDRKGSSSDPS